MKRANTKSNFFIGICSIVWGGIYFLYKLFFPTSVYDLPGNKAFQYSSEQITQYKETLSNTISILEVLFLLLLIALCVISIVNCRKKGLRLLDRESLSFSVLFLIVGMVFHILGALGISWIFAVISGILAIIWRE